VRLPTGKEGSHRIHMDRFSLKKLKEEEDKEQCRLQILNSLNL
jgi:hypothetical protein